MDERKVHRTLHELVVLQGQGCSFVLFEPEFDFLEFLVDELVVEAVEVDLLDVFLGALEQRFRFFDFLLHNRNVAFELLQFLPELKGQVEELEEVFVVLAAELFDEFLGLVLKFDEFVLPLDHEFVVGLFLLEDVDDEGCWVEGGVPELVLLRQELLDLISDIN